MLTAGDPRVRSHGRHANDAVRSLYNSNIGVARSWSPLPVTTCRTTRARLRVRSLGWTMLPVGIRSRREVSFTKAATNLLKRVKRIGVGFTRFRNYRFKCSSTRAGRNRRFCDGHTPLKRQNQSPASQGAEGVRISSATA